MPVLIIYGISEPMSRKLEELTDTLIDTVAFSVAELQLKTSDVSVFYPKDWMPKGLGEELVIFVDGLFDKPERTEEVRKRLADAITETAYHFFPKIRLIECFIRPFNLKQGYSSRRLTSEIKKADFPETLELGGTSKAELVATVLAAGYEITSQALDLISHSWFTVLPQKKLVKLRRKTVAEMGFTGEWTLWHEIKEWVEKNGKICDDELSLRLRLAYQNQPIDEELYIANEFQFFRIANFSGKPSIFRNGIDGLRTNMFATGKNSAMEDSTAYCLYNEFVYCEK